MGPEPNNFTCNNSRFVEMETWHLLTVFYCHLGKEGEYPLYTRQWPPFLPKEMLSVNLKSPYWRHVAGKSPFFCESWNLRWRTSQRLKAKIQVGENWRGKKLKHKKLSTKKVSDYIVLCPSAKLRRGGAKPRCALTFLVLCPAYREKVLKQVEKMV